MSDAVGVSEERFATHEADVGWPFLERMYTLQPVKLFGDQASYRLDARSWAAGPIGYIELLHSMGFITRSEPFTDLMAVLIRRGSLTIKGRHQQTTIGPGEVGVYLPLVDLQFLAPMIGVECLRVPLRELSSIAAEQTGIDAHDFRLEGMRPISAAKGRYWRSLLHFVGREISSQSSALGAGLVQAEMARMVAASAITVFPNTAMRVAHPPRPGRVEPAALRRASLSSTPTPRVRSPCRTWPPPPAPPLELCSRLLPATATPHRPAICAESGSNTPTVSCRPLTRWTAPPSDPLLPAGALSVLAGSPPSTETPTAPCPVTPSAPEAWPMLVVQSVPAATDCNEERLSCGTDKRRACETRHRH